jgi:hypothetical protein
MQRTRPCVRTSDGPDLVHPTVEGVPLGGLPRVRQALAHDQGPFVHMQSGPMTCQHQRPTALPLFLFQDAIDVRFPRST